MKKFELKVLLIMLGISIAVIGPRIVFHLIDAAHRVK